MTRFQDPVAFDRLLPLMVGSYGATLVVLLAASGRGLLAAIDYALLDSLPFAAVTILGGAVLFYLVRLVIWVRPKSPFRRLAGDTRALLGHPEQLLPIGWLLLLMIVFTSFFSAWKALIPDLNPFSWDPAFYQFDRFLHGGTDPWRITHAVFGNPLSTFVINVLYHLWFFVMHFSYVWVATLRGNDALRLQYLLTFFASWIFVGTVAAIFFSSAGPCYFGRVTDAVSPYAELMQLLANHDGVFPVWALDVQALLWNNYLHAGSGPTSAISAMPSMHVGSTLLLVLLVRRAGNTAARVLAPLFLISILIGSVHLGWHYAIDGYLAVLLILPLWWIAGKVVDVREQRRTLRMHAS